jgi:hypothetical protein
VGGFNVANVAGAMALLKLIDARQKILPSCRQFTKDIGLMDSFKPYHYQLLFTKLELQ